MQDLWDLTRRSVIGGEKRLATPFGQRRLTYADHTASGRGVTFIEDSVLEVLETYGNTHTEDDATGTITSEQLRLAEQTIKGLVNAGPRHRIITVGSGTTGAVHQLQQILGIYVPPAGKDLFRTLLRQRFSAGEAEELELWMSGKRPVVFVGPFEHHSNEVSWRECFAEVVEIELTGSGLLDLDDLAGKLQRPGYSGRRKIGAFSAASNVTGVKTPVYEVARILHAHQALALFDFAAAAPYERIDMNRDKDSFFDAVYFSPHKFLGGPGSCGILIIHDGIYRSDLPPTVGAGGTVEFVNFAGQAYIPDIEAREKAGTPGILQTLRAALAMELKEKLGPERIAAREEALARSAHGMLSGIPGIELMGNAATDQRLPIFSFTIRVGSSYLHPRFVTVLLNDLFGIQSRAGCSCAAPYGHRLLHIDQPTSRRLERTIMRGNIGLKPGWTRVNFHFLHTDAEAEFICAAIRFVAEHGTDFLPLYTFDIRTGAWRHNERSPEAVSFGLDSALGGPFAGGPRNDRPQDGAPEAPVMEPSDQATLFDSYLAEAERLAQSLRKRFSGRKLSTTERDLIPFLYSS
ncbi:MAG: aminotransferase class V-fold PLP-dependent enzyme [Spirochaetia bacterium]|jgi:selenocysteine lyase/cysteine desulfurase